MKLIIDIPDTIGKHIKESYNIHLSDTTLMKIKKAIKNGIPLPKGHGRLMILSEDKLKENLFDLAFSCEKWISEVDLSNATVTIIESDKEN